MSDEGGAVVMWEAKAAPGRADDLVAHVRRTADDSAEIYRSADDRVVVIDPTGRGLDDVPAELIDRPPHAWHFDRVER
jgi:hypothetical protein